MSGIFGEFFLVSVSHETKHEKSSKNSGRKIEKFGKLSFCNFSDLKIWLEVITSRDAKSACFKGSRISFSVIIFGHFFGQVLPQKDHNM